MIAVITKEVQRLLMPHNKLAAKWLAGPDRLAEVLQALALTDVEERPAEQLLLGLCGMSGIGKTAIALAVHDIAAQHISRRVFLEVGTDCKEGSELMMRKCCQLLQDLYISNSPISYTSRPQVQKALRSALTTGGAISLVLDDLGTDEQLRWLLGCENSSESLKEVVAAMPKSSLVLLTSQDKAVTTVPRCLELTVLNEVSSIQLLCSEAFGQLNPPIELAVGQLQQALALCGGLPLALRLLGRQLKGLDLASWQVQCAASAALSDA